MKIQHFLVLGLLLVTLAGCGGSNDGGNAAPGSSGTPGGTATNGASTGKTKAP